MNNENTGKNDALSKSFEAIQKDIREAQGLCNHMIKTLEKYFEERDKLNKKFNSDI